MLSNDLTVDVMHDFMKPFGFGQITGIDLEHERKGVLPSTAWKRSVYKKAAQQKWYAGETISLGIGQGYNTFTPLQLAHAMATLANNGIVMKPHLVKMTEDPQSRQKTLIVAKESARIPLKQENIDFIKNAMVGVTTVAGGTGYAVFHDAAYIAGGKTGTAQVVALKTGEKYDAKKTAERQRDHSLFIAFAPADKPRIALAIVVENGGFGSAAAAPIVRKALDYYLLGKRPNDKDKTPAEKSDILAVRAESEARADAESEGGPKPGGVTPGNKD